MGKPRVLAAWDTFPGTAQWVCAQASCRLPNPVS